MSVPHLLQAIVGPDQAWFLARRRPGRAYPVPHRRCGVADAFTILESLVEPGVGPSLHVHRDRDEIFEVPEGRFRFHCAGETSDVTADAT